ncbi:hypothetical protein TWF730_004680 [Orbilia blumenaviensis]|uniref:Dynactin subunit n=1 Tax=Orbilia blumenaviensis TaxID=1796055 RepID=A0AAV9TW17_9PEZI
MAATNRKYSALPDIDTSAKDVFETPDLTDDSTLPTSPSRGDGDRSSATSQTDDDDDDDDEHREISHPRLHPRLARNVFKNAQVDASNADFSDRIASKRQSYRTTTLNRQRSRMDEGERELYGDDEDEMFDDGEEGGIDGEERVGKRLARLRREMEELKEMIEKEREEKEEFRLEQGISEGEDSEEGDQDEESWEQLAEVMEELMTAKGKGGGAEADLARKLANGLKVVPPRITGAPDDPQAPAAAAASSETAEAAGGIMANYTVTYSPHFKKTHTLAKVAEFDSRITLLERLLGISSAQSLASIPTNFAIISSLETLTQQLTVLTNTSASSLDAAARRVKSLASDAEKLTEARKAAKAALESRRAAGEEEAVIAGTLPEGPSYLSDAENEAKVNALYGTLDTIDRLSPLLPAVLDRLRSLRSVHGEAARSMQTLEMVEKRQEEMQIEITKWKEALEKVETAVGENEKTVGGNMQQVEQWVRVLEEKVRQL